MTIQQPPSEKRDIEAIVIDLDGTLLNSDHVMSERNRETIRRAIDAGKQVFIATGKTRTSADSVIAALNLQTPGVYLQGLMIFNADGTLRRETKLEPHILRRVINYGNSNGYSIIAYSGNRLIMQKLDNNADLIASFGEPMPEAVGPLVNLVDTMPIHKIVFIADSFRQIKALRWQFNQQVGGQVYMTTAKVLTSLEVLPKGTSKGNGVKSLMRDLGIKLANVMAIGDGENDIEMIKMAGLGVAMGNAEDMLKDVAQEITLTNDEDGVAEAIEKFVIGKPPAPEPEPVVEVAAAATESSETPSVPDADASEVTSAPESNSDAVSETAPASDVPATPEASAPPVETDEATTASAEATETTPTPADADSTPAPDGSDEQQSDS